VATYESAAQAVHQILSHPLLPLADGHFSLLSYIRHHLEVGAFFFFFVHVKRLLAAGG
jgi:hypothetical protein